MVHSPQNEMGLGLSLSWGQECQSRLPLFDYPRVDLMVHSAQNAKGLGLSGSKRGTLLPVLWPQATGNPLLPSGALFSFFGQGCPFQVNQRKGEGVPVLPWPLGI